MSTLKQHAYRIIREKLVTGAIKPGSRLSDDLLAREMGISRSPVREAISQLASEGLVEHHPHSGAYVKQPDRRELEELFEIREALERYAARRAAVSINREELRKLRQLGEQMLACVQQCRELGAKIVPLELVRCFLAQDLAFHTTIVDAAGNSQLTKLVTDFKVLIQTFTFEPLRHDVRALACADHDHRRIVQALQKRDAKAAGMQMAKHIRAAKRRMLTNYGKPVEC